MIFVNAVAKPKLSDLNIDVSKDWDAKKIENLGAPDSGDDAKRHDSAPETHGAAQHTNVTRELFIPALSAYSSGVASVFAWYPSYELADAQNKEVRLSMKVPDDFVSFISAKAVWLCAAAAGNMYWRLQAYYAASPQAYNQHTDTPALGVTATGGNNIMNVQEPANALTLTDLAKGDYICFYFTRGGTDDLDTLNTKVLFLGLLFTYTAEQ